MIQKSLKKKTAKAHVHDPVSLVCYKKVLAFEVDFSQAVALAIH